MSGVTPSESVRQLADVKSKAYLEAPAGYGKTEAIADAVALCEGRQLVLTHTHAGVDSLRKRLRAKDVSPKSYRLDTIFAWCLRFVSAYPSSSGYVVSDEPDWVKVAESMQRLLGLSAIRKVIEAGFSGVIVDEYQDCSEAQHKIVEQLAQILPVRIVGDPLQGIFNFDGEKLVDWSSAIYPTYTRVPSISEPWRWKAHNSGLGDWLIETRQRLIEGKQPDYSSPSITHVTSTTEKQKHDAIRSVKAAKDESLVVLVKFPTEAHALAQKMPGYVSMEEIECKELIKASKAWDGKAGAELILHIFEFVGKCCTQPTQSLRTIKGRLESANFNNLSALVPKELSGRLEELGSSASLDEALELCKMVAALDGRRMYRRELFYAMLQALRLKTKRPNLSLHECARQVRERVSHVGRRETGNLISRVLLVKGLEYDHVVVLDPSKLNNRELYVALTRAKKSLTVIQGPVTREATSKGTSGSTGQESLFDDSE